MSFQEREKMGDGSCPVEKMEPISLLNSPEAQMKQNSETRVNVTTHSREKSKSSSIGCLSRLKSHPFTILSMVFNIVLFSILMWSVRKYEGHPTDPKSPGASCPDGWVGYQRKCYYFSEMEGNWTYSRSQCSFLGASLAGIDTEQEMAFMKRYKGLPDHWISFWRKPNGTWKLANGSDLNNGLEIRGGGECVYLNKARLGSSSCSTKRNWICSSHSQSITSGANSKQLT